MTEISIAVLREKIIKTGAVIQLVGEKEEEIAKLKHVNQKIWSKFHEKTKELAETRKALNDHMVYIENASKTTEAIKTDFDKLKSEHVHIEQKYNEILIKYQNALLEHTEKTTNNAQKKNSSKEIKALSKLVEKLKLEISKKDETILNLKNEQESHVCNDDPKNDKADKLEDELLSINLENIRLKELLEEKRSRIQVTNTEEVENLKELHEKQISALKLKHRQAISKIQEECNALREKLSELQLERNILKFNGGNEATNPNCDESVCANQENNHVDKLPEISPNKTVEFPQNNEGNQESEETAAVEDRAPQDDCLEAPQFKLPELYVEEASTTQKSLSNAATKREDHVPEQNCASKTGVECGYVSSDSVSSDNVFDILSRMKCMLTPLSPVPSDDEVLDVPNQINTILEVEEEDTPPNSKVNGREHEESPGIPTAESSCGNSRLQPACEGDVERELVVDVVHLPTPDSDAREETPGDVLKRKINNSDKSTINPPNTRKQAINESTIITNDNPVEGFLQETVLHQDSIDFNVGESELKTSWEEGEPQALNPTKPVRKGGKIVGNVREMPSRRGSVSTTTLQVLNGFKPDVTSERGDFHVTLAENELCATDKQDVIVQTITCESSACKLAQNAHSVQLDRCESPWLLGFSNVPTTARESPPDVLKVNSRSAKKHACKRNRKKNGVLNSSKSVSPVKLLKTYKEAITKSVIKAVLKYIPAASLQNQNGKNHQDATKRTKKRLSYKMRRPTLSRRASIESEYDTTHSECDRNALMKQMKRNRNLLLMRAIEKRKLNNATDCDSSCEEQNKMLKRKMYNYNGLVPQIEMNNICIATNSIEESDELQTDLYKNASGIDKTLKHSASIGNHKEKDVTVNISESGSDATNSPKTNEEISNQEKRTSDAVSQESEGSIGSTKSPPKSKRRKSSSSGEDSNLEECKKKVKIDEKDQKSVDSGYVVTDTESSDTIQTKASSLKSLHNDTFLELLEQGKEVNYFGSKVLSWRSQRNRTISLQVYSTTPYTEIESRRSMSESELATRKMGRGEVKEDSFAPEVREVRENLFVNKKKSETSAMSSISKGSKVSEAEKLTVFSKNKGENTSAQNVDLPSTTENTSSKPNSGFEDFIISGTSSDSSTGKPKRQLVKQKKKNGKVAVELSVEKEDKNKKYNDLFGSDIDSETSVSSNYKEKSVAPKSKDVDLLNLPNKEICKSDIEVKKGAMEQTPCKSKRAIKTNSVATDANEKSSMKRKRKIQTSVVQDLKKMKREESECTENNKRLSAELFGSEMDTSSSDEYVPLARLKGSATGETFIKLTATAKNFKVSRALDNKKENNLSINSVDFNRNEENVYAPNIKRKRIAHDSKSTKVTVAAPIKNVVELKSNNVDGSASLGQIIKKRLEAVEIVKTSLTRKEAERKTFKRPNITKKALLSCDTPQSPEHELDLPEDLLIEPIIIPTEKPKRMTKKNADCLFEELLNYPMEETIVGKVSTAFMSQDVPHIASLVIHRVSQDIHDTPDMKYTPPVPPTTDAQRTLLGFMKHLECLGAEGLLDCFISQAEKKILSLRQLPLTDPITRLYTASCMYKKDIYRVRRFCCDCLYFMGNFAIPCLYVILSCWFDVLPCKEDLADCLVSKVIVSVLYSKACNEPGYKLKQLKTMLTEYYKYPLEDYLNPTKTFSNIWEEYMNNPTKVTGLAIKVLFKNCQSDWVHLQIKNFVPSLRLVADDVKAQMIDFISDILDVITTESDQKMFEDLKSLLLSIYDGVNCDDVCKTIDRRMKTFPLE